jgi:hypothetical protein
VIVEGGGGVVTCGEDEHGPDLISLFKISKTIDRSKVELEFIIQLLVL